MFGRTIWMAALLGLATLLGGTAHAQRAPEAELPRARAVVAQAIRAQPELAYLSRPEYALMRQHLVDYVALGRFGPEMVVPGGSSRPPTGVEIAQNRDVAELRRWEAKISRVLGAPYTNTQALHAAEYVDFELRQFLRELRALELRGHGPFRVYAVGSLPQGRFGAASDVDLVVNLDGEGRIPDSPEWRAFEERWGHRARASHDGALGLLTNRRPDWGGVDRVELDQATRDRVIAEREQPFRDRFLSEIEGRNAVAGEDGARVDVEALRRQASTTEARGRAGFEGRVARLHPEAAAALAETNGELARRVSEDPVEADRLLERLDRLRGSTNNRGELTLSQVQQAMRVLDDRPFRQRLRERLGARVGRLQQLGAIYSRAFLEQLRQSRALRPVSTHLTAMFSTVYLYTVIRLMSEEPDLRGDDLFLRAAQLAFSREALVALGVGTGVGVLGMLPVAALTQGLTSAGMRAVRAVGLSSVGGVLGVLGAEVTVNVWRLWEDEALAREAREQAIARLDSQEGQRLQVLSERYLDRSGFEVLREALRSERLDLVMILATGAAAGVGAAIGAVNPFLAAAAAMAAAGAAHASLSAYRDRSFDPTALAAEHAATLARRLELGDPPRSPVRGAAGMFASLGGASTEITADQNARWIGDATKRIHGGVDYFLDEARDGNAALQTGLLELHRRLLESRAGGDPTATEEAVSAANQVTQGLAAATTPNPGYSNTGNEELDLLLRSIWMSYWKARLALDHAIELRAQGENQLVAMRYLAEGVLPTGFPELLDIEGRRVEEELARQLWALETLEGAMGQGTSAQELATMVDGPTLPDSPPLPEQSAPASGGLFGIPAGP